MVKTYIPDRGHVVIINLDPQQGTEMTKRRPCLVLSNKVLNQKLNRALICPITTSPVRILTHLELPNTLENVSGTVVVDQIKSLDFTSRNDVKIDELKNDYFFKKLLNIVERMITS